MKNILNKIVGKKEKTAVVKAGRENKGRGRRASILVQYKGRKMSLAEVSDMNGMSYMANFMRYSHGWTGKEIVEGRK